MDNTLSRKELLRRIQALSFYAVDLNLFLDTHPTDAQALRDYNYVLQQLEQLKRLYSQQYGSLLNFGEATVTGNSWSWVTGDEPWPWERQGD